VQAKYGYPYTFSVAWAKNQKAEVFDIVFKLIKSPKFNQGLTVSVQSMDLDVLENIKRKNLDQHKISDIFNLCDKHNVPVYTEVILGLPGETKTSWRQNFWKLFDAGNHTGVTILQAQMLENAEMNLLQRKLFGIKSVPVYDYMSGSYNYDELQESVDVIVATKDMPFEDMLDSHIFSWYINTFKGKQAIIDNCEQVSSYFKSVTTDFKTLNIIAEGNKVVINGTAEFLRNNQRVSFITACDVYEFDDNNQIQNITSYCIQKR
jgi:hypothetical protein